MLRLKVLMCFIVVALASCTATPPADPLRPESLTPTEAEQVDSLLKKLYRSFSYGEGKEPDWELMQSVFIDGAQFVTEPRAGEAPKSQSVEAFISSWQASIRGSKSVRPGHDEWITGTRITKVGQLIRVDVTFQASKSNESVPRKPGLDSLVLVNVGGVWQVLSFIVQYESKR